MMIENFENNFLSSHQYLYDNIIIFLILVISIEILWIFILVFKTLKSGLALEDAFSCLYYLSRS